MLGLWPPAPQKPVPPLLPPIPSGMVLVRLQDGEVAAIRRCLVKFAQSSLHVVEAEYLSGDIFSLRTESYDEARRVVAALAEGGP